MLGACWASLAAAQADSDQPKVDPKFESHAEQAQREADKVFKWIRIHSDSPKRPAAPAAAGTPAAPALASKAPAAQAGPERSKAPVPVAPAPPVREPARVPAAVMIAASAPSAGTVTVVPQPERASPAALASSVEAGQPAAHPAPGGASDQSTAAEQEPPPLEVAASVEPEFPAILMRRLRKGWVHVRLAVNPDGTVGHAEVVGSSHPRLHEPAIAAVKRWLFRPPGQARQATAEIEFDLDGQ
ncbi:TonB family protein [Ideonella sp. YS5]|uniref:energy transducer TonB n=1 Tax=Ideonella sp. YS5 TaxID=3453714 RepID=UPI003EEA484F